LDFSQDIFFLQTNNFSLAFNPSLEDSDMPDLVLPHDTAIRLFSVLYYSQGYGGKAVTSLKTKKIVVTP
jgi:hypothetical protein